MNLYGVLEGEWTSSFGDAKKLFFPPGTRLKSPLICLGFERIEI